MEHGRIDETDRADTGTSLLAAYGSNRQVKEETKTALHERHTDTVSAFHRQLGICRDIDKGKREYAPSEGKESKLRGGGVDVVKKQGVEGVQQVIPS